MREKRLLRFRVQRYTKIAITLVIILILAGVIVLHMAQHPFKKEQTLTTDLVEKYANFHDVSNFRVNSQGTTYYSLEGKNKDNKPAFAVVNSKMNNIKVFKKSDGINQKQAEMISRSSNNQKITNSGLILIKNKPAWLISLKNSQGGYEYVTINFKNGKKIETINV